MESWFHKQACPDGARKMLETCLLECQKVAAKLPKTQNVATEILHILSIFWNFFCFSFLFSTIITNIGPEKLLEVSFKEMLAIIGEILRVLSN